MKDNAKIYEIPPQLLPDSANSLSVVIDYSGMEFSDEAQMKDAMLQDNILAMLGINYKMADQSIMEIKVYGQKDGKNDFLFQGAPDEASNGTDGFIPAPPLKKDVLPHGTVMGGLRRFHRLANSILTGSPDTPEA